MKLLNNLLDRFNKAEFTVASNKKLKTISQEFKANFDLTLVFYKGSVIAEGDLTLAGLDKRTSKKANPNASALKVKGSMKVEEVEKLFDQQFGVTVQIKDKSGKRLVPNEITLGQATREEYK
jgi:hypothetical protein